MLSPGRSCLANGVKFGKEGADSAALLPGSCIFHHRVDDTYLHRGHKSCIDLGYQYEMEV